jgi:hypothetical protein
VSVLGVFITAAALIAALTLVLGFLVFRPSDFGLNLVSEWFGILVGGAIVAA